MRSLRSHRAFSSSNKRGEAPTDGETRENLWTSLLDSVASGKRLPEKNLLVLGGAPETQKEFLDTLTTDTSKRPHERYRKKPPIANEFALGYTYQDVLDADQEDLIARMSIYTLLEPSPLFAPLIKPLFTSRTIPETLLLILLDWAEPWNWVRQVRDWIRLIHEALVNLDDDAKDMMEDTMVEWQQRKRGGGVTDSNMNTNTDPIVTIPLGPGEWDEALGLPLCVVCHHSDKIDVLEKEQGWGEEDFDYVLQFLRTILLKHGASLIYTSNSTPNSLSSLIQSSLGIHSLLKRQPLKHNVIDRDRILIPPNWDSWGKIRVLREGFDVEGISNGWSSAIQVPVTHAPHTNSGSGLEIDERKNQGSLSKEVHESGLLLAYEEMIQDQKNHSLASGQNASTRCLDIEVVSTQEFLVNQMEAIERMKVEEEQNQTSRDRSINSGSSAPSQDHASGIVEEGGRVNEHIGPVQFNMGGIQVDAEDVLKRLKDREQEETPDRELPGTPTPDGRSQNEALANFFAGLMKRGGASSPRTNPS